MNYQRHCWCKNKSKLTVFNQDYVYCASCHTLISQIERDDESYLVKNDELVLGPFQGPVACTRIKKGKGVCGASWAKSQTLIVPDVEKFPGHIACSSLSRSEIVVPIIRNNKVIGVLDVDSIEPDQYDNIDQDYLEQITELINF